MDFYKKFPREKVATHLKSFLGVIQNIWHGRNACDKKIIQHLLEAQCATLFKSNCLDVFWQGLIIACVPM